MNNIWLILFLLAGFGQSDGCNKQPGCGCVQGSKNCEKKQSDCGGKKEYCPNQVQAVPFQRDGDGQNRCCEMSEMPEDE